MLVCTTIIESGLDISSANTLIVERADELGLASSTRSAAGWAARRSARTPTCSTPRGRAHGGRRARLATLSDYTELGSGFKIAMRDLEIRGAGNLLGDEQSGHVAAVGFELYVGMLDEAVDALAGDSAEEAPEPVRVDLPVDAFVPGDYVPYEAAKIEVHRRVAGAKEIADLIVLREELEDRFGPVPEPLDDLIRLQDARIKLGRAGARTVDFAGGKLAVAPIELDSRRVKILRERVRGGVRIGPQHSARAGSRRSGGALPGGGDGGGGDPGGGYRTGRVRTLHRYHPPPRPVAAVPTGRRQS